MREEEGEEVVMVVLVAFQTKAFNAKASGPQKT